VAAIQRTCSDSRIPWRRLRYHKSPTAAATGYDIVRGAAEIAFQVRGRKARLIHARSYVPAMMAWLAKRIAHCPLLFDMRGFWVDERVEGGLWAAGGSLFRAGKWWEKRLLRAADAVVVLASAAVPHLETLAGRAVQAPVAVIPTCVDLREFAPGPRREVRERFGLPQDSFVLVHAGSLGGWYMGTETFSLAAAVASQVERFAMVVLTQQVEDAEALVPQALRPRTRILSVGHDAVPAWMAAADAGIVLVRPSFSKVASCPTKLGEYLASGLPVASTAGIGDVDRVLGPDVGVLLGDVDPESLRAAAQTLVALASHPRTAQRCRDVATRYFSLDTGVEKLLGLYHALGMGHY
jgi:glycosyltransferase involved in cell wall biosynthesis